MLSDLIPRKPNWIQFIFLFFGGILCFLCTLMAFLPVPIPAIPLLLIALGSLVTTLLICKLFTTETREDVRGGAGWGWIVIPPIFLIPQITFWLSLGPR